MAIQLAYSLQGLIWIKLRAPADARACWAVTLSTAICSGLPVHCGRTGVVCYFCSPRYSDNWLGGLRMFDVYLNTKREIWCWVAPAESPFSF